ncbi:MAG TPA: hypothetical protein VIO38_09000, partial [Rariglobus sp.]
ALAAMPLEDAQAKFKAMWAEAGGGAEAGENLLESMPAYREAIYAAGNAAGVTGEDFDVLAWATGDAGDAAEAAAPKFDLTTEAADRQVVTLEELLELQRDLADVAMGVSASEIAFQESIDAATDALNENGASLDLNTEAGRANRSALDGIAASGWDAVEALDANGASTEDVRAKMQSARDAFIETATQMGMTGEAANALADEYGLIPEVIKTEAELDKAQAEADLAALAKQIEGLPNGVVSISTVGYAQTYQYLSNIQAAMSTINGTRVRIGMGAGGSGGMTFADGGPVFGPGTSTSDSIPARLSNGEYVIKADSVKAYGRSFFDAVNAQRFAAGGPVGVPQVNVSAPPSQVFAGPVTLSQRSVQDIASAMLAGAGAVGEATARKSVQMSRQGVRH